MQHRGQAQDPPPRIPAAYGPCDLKSMCIPISDPTSHSQGQLLRKQVMRNRCCRSTEHTHISDNNTGTLQAYSYTYGTQKT